MEPNIYPKHIISGFDKICDKELELLDEDERDELINKFEKEMWPGTVFVTALRNSIDSLLYKFNNFPDFPDDAFTIVQKLDRNKKIRENETSEDIKNFLINKEIVGNKKGLLAFKEFDKILSGPLLKVNELIRNADTNIVEQADELNNIEIGDSKIHIRVQYTGEARTRAEYVKRFTKCLGWIRSNEIQTYEEGGKLYAKKIVENKLDEAKSIIYRTEKLIGELKKGGYEELIIKNEEELLNTLSKKIIKINKGRETKKERRKVIRSIDNLKEMQGKYAKSKDGILSELEKLKTTIKSKWKEEFEEEIILK